MIKKKFYIFQCCAVSFIENLTAESLSMSEEEFAACMSGKVSVVSAWESALIACESMNQFCEHLTLLKCLTDRNSTIQEGTKKLSEEIDLFQASSVHCFTLNILLIFFFLL